MRKLQLAVVGALSLLFAVANSADLPRLLIKIPTYSRPEKFFQRLDLYYQKLSGEFPVTFLISCDEEDATMNNEGVIERLKSYPNLHYGFSKHSSKIEAYNRDIEKFDFDILVLASDDMEPVVDGYDKVIAERMIKEFPAFDGVLNFCDGHVWAVINTFPVIGKKFFDLFGYAYNPAYRSFHCDNELSAVARILRKECVCDEIIISHKHPLWTHEVADFVYQKSQGDFRADEALYAVRRGNYFGLDKTFMESLCTKDWSILISISDQHQAHAKILYEKLCMQIKKCGLEDKVEVLCADSHVGPTMGYRKDKLLWASNGHYVSFVDDISDISSNFVSLVYEKIKKRPDIVCLRGKAPMGNGAVLPFISFVNGLGSQSIPGYSAMPPRSFDVIKRYIAVQFVFDRADNDEHEWEFRLISSGLLRVQEIVDEDCYFISDVVPSRHFTPHIYERPSKMKQQGRK